MGSYKNVTTETNVSSVEDACSALEELASECREIVDNAEGGLAETARIQTFGETADTLEGISTPDIPECVADLPMTVVTQASTRKGRGESRNVRCANEVAVLSAARDAVDEWINTRTGEIEDAGGTVDDDEDVQAAVEFVGELENIIGDAEGCEFPGMFG